MYDEQRMIHAARDAASICHLVGNTSTTGRACFPQVAVVGSWGLGELQV